MSFRISNIRLGLDESEAALPAAVARVLGTDLAPPAPWRILRKSLDARDKDNLQFVYSLAVELPEDEARIATLAGPTGPRGQRGARLIQERLAMPAARST